MEEDDAQNGVDHVDGCGRWLRSAQRKDPDSVNHLKWYMSTGFTKPYPGAKKVRLPSEFNNPTPAGDDSDD